LDYLDRLRKNVFAMIRQLCPPTFFMTFTTCVNYWPILIKTLKDLYDQYIGENSRIKKDDSLSIKELVRNDCVTCACYYENRMNSFCKLIQNIDLIFGKVKDYFFIIEFQSRGLPHDHGLLWVQNAPIFGVSKNEKIQCFVDKYLTINQTILSIEIHNIQIHQHKRTCRKKSQLICRFQYPKSPMKHTKILLLLDEQDHMPNHGEMTYL